MKHFFQVLLLTAAWPALSHADPVIYTLTTDISGLSYDFTPTLSGTWAPGTVVDVQFSVPSLLTSPTTITSFLSDSVGGSLSGCSIASVQVPYSGSIAGYASAVLVSFGTGCGPGNIVAGTTPAFEETITSPGSYIAYAHNSGTPIGTLTISPEPSTFAMLLLPLAWLGVRKLRRIRSNKEGI